MALPILVDWNKEKDISLRENRGLSFSAVVNAMNNGKLLGNLEHHKPDHYQHQRIFVVEIDGYACVVPYVPQGQRVFLKTIYRSRYYTKKYLN